MACVAARPASSIAAAASKSLLTAAEAPPGKTSANAAAATCASHGNWPGRPGSPFSLPGHHRLYVQPPPLEPFLPTLPARATPTCHEGGQQRPWTDSATSCCARMPKRGKELAPQETRKYELPIGEFGQTGILRLLTTQGNSDLRSSRMDVLPVTLLGGGRSLRRSAASRRTLTPNGTPFGRGWRWFEFFDVARSALNAGIQD